MMGEQPKGVLQFFSLQPVDFDPAWQDFLHSLALQMAIALDRSEIFFRMEMAHVELTAAYESTLEGWSRALDLREHETAGHSQRVVEMTLALAGALGLGAEHSLTTPRCALHDIGKMGVPDRLLLKPGP
jgi:HD-GYP domain-containing protein (c-di-GMP phosphodiesterase class II)